MKTIADPRHQRRIKIIRDLFAQSFHRQAFISDTAKSIMSNLVTIDSLIQKAAPEWPVDKIAKIDLAILRLAVYELIVVKKEPPKVIIDEAVEIAKQFGGEKGPAFINGVLGTIIKN